MAPRTPLISLLLLSLSGEASLIDPFLPPPRGGGAASGRAAGGGGAAARRVGGPSATKRVAISNPHATVTFEASATDGWPSSISAAARPGAAAVAIALGPRAPGSWEVALHNATDTATLLKVYPANCSSFALDTSEPAALSMVWRGCSGRHRVAVDVTTRWVLPEGSDTLHTTVEAEVTRPEDTPYRLWLARHPRIAIQPLGTDGSDRLARGILGGEILVRYHYIVMLSRFLCCAAIVANPKSITITGRPDQVPRARERAALPAGRGPEPRR